MGRCNPIRRGPSRDGVPRSLEHALFRGRTTPERPASVLCAKPGSVDCSWGLFRAYRGGTCLSQRPSPFLSPIPLGSATYRVAAFPYDLDRATGGCPAGPPPRFARGSRRAGRNPLLNSHFISGGLGRAGPGPCLTRHESKICRVRLGRSGTCPDRLQLLPVDSPDLSVLVVQRDWPPSSRCPVRARR